MATIGELTENSIPVVDTDKVIDQLVDEQINGIEPGKSIGLDGLEPYYTIPPFGQLNVMAGVPGCGKTAIMNFYAVKCAENYGWRTFFNSPESHPRKHAQKLIEIHLGRPVKRKGRMYNGFEPLTTDEILEQKPWVKKHFCFAKRDKRASLEEIFNAIKLESVQKRADMVVIDPFNRLEMRLGVKENEHKWIGRMLSDAQAWAMEKNIQMWICAHPKKPRVDKNGDFVRITPYDFSGSSYWFDMPDNIFIPHRTREQKTGFENEAELSVYKIKEDDYGKCKDLLIKQIPANKRYEFIGELSV